MTRAPFGGTLDPNLICLSFDVEWACREVIDDVRSLLDERGLTGTFFVTHAGVDVGRHERGLHPNYRRSGDVYRALPDAASRTDAEIYEHVLTSTLAFAPEARGARSHSLFFDSALLPMYARLGVEYDATFRLELVPNLQPFWKQYGIVEIPTYYADYFDLVTQATGFEPGRLGLDALGMKVFDFHPNLIYINAPDLASYDASRPYYHDPERLLAMRHTGRGTRTLFIELLDYVACADVAAISLGAINAAVRASTRPPRPASAS